ncbi:unnamed protein product [Amoebophrya sp. A120]|nr:unnamed protein product [Amoebophrya sp. A120]|eukprot:GSA120T00009312001.1
MAALIPVAAGMCAPGCASAVASGAAAVVGGSAMLSAAPVLAVGAGAAAVYSYMKSSGSENRGEGGDDDHNEDFQDANSDNEQDGVQLDGEKKIVRNSNPNFALPKNEKRVKLTLTTTVNKAAAMEENDTSRTEDHTAEDELVCGSNSSSKMDEQTKKKVAAFF